jgi:hypothetical protein
MDIDTPKRRVDVWEKFGVQRALRRLRSGGLRSQVRGPFPGKVIGSLAPATGTAPIEMAAAASPQAIAPREDECGEIVSALLGCWPEPLLAVARRIGVTKAELDAWLAGKGILPCEALSRLMSVFGLASLHKEHAACAKRPVTTAGQYVLLAGNEPQRVSRAYTFLIGRCAKAASIELLPAGHLPANRWRYLLVMRQPGLAGLICFPRTGRSARMLESGQLPRFHGQIPVAPALYDAIEALRADVEQRPARVLKAMGEMHALRTTEIAQVGAKLQSICEEAAAHPK